MLDIIEMAWAGPVFLILTLAFLVLAGPRFVRLIISYLLYYRQRSEKLSLQAQITEYRKELSTISQVDEFAKYSRVQRKLKATTTELNTIARKDLELNIKYVLVGQACVWLMAIMICLKLLYQVYEFLSSALGFR